MSKRKKGYIKEWKTQKQERKREKYFLWGSIVLWLFVFILPGYLISIMGNYELSASQRHMEKRIIGAQGYEVTGRSYRMTGEDPRIILTVAEQDNNRMKGMVLRFKKKLRKDVKITVYDLDDKQGGESPLAEGVAQRGLDETTLTFPAGKYRAFALSIQGNFVLSEICAVYKEETLGVRICLLLLDVLLAGWLILCYRRKNRVYHFWCDRVERAAAFFARRWKLEEGVAFLLLGAVLCLIPVWGGQRWLALKTEEALTVEESFQAKDRTVTEAYKVRGNHFTLTNYDPKVIFEHKMIYNLDRIKIKFAKGLEKSTLVQVFYSGKSEEWSPDRCASIVLKKGEDVADFSIPTGNYNRIRLDVDCDFYLDGVYYYYRKADVTLPWGYHAAAASVPLLFAVLWLACFFAKNKWYRLSVRGCRAVWQRYLFFNRRLCFFGRRHTIRLEKVFLALGLLLGISYAVLVPPGQVPDEAESHSRMMSESLGYGEKTFEEMFSFYNKISYSKIGFDQAIKQSPEEIFENMDVKFSSEARKIKHLPSVQVFRYLPAAVGFMVCVTLNLPIYFCLQIAEICSVLFYAVLGFFALKRIPILKGALFTVMLLPMTLQQCASISYDVVVLVGMFWVFSYLVYCIAEKEKVGWRDLLPLAAWLFVIGSAKPPYAFLFLLFFAIPREKVALPLWKVENLYGVVCKYWYVVLAVAVLAGGILLPNSQYNYLVKAVFSAPSHTLDMLYSTMDDLGDFYRNSMVGNFGWLTRPMPDSFVWFSCILMLLTAICSAGHRRKDALPGRVLSILGVAVCAVLVLLAMVSWTFHAMDAENAYANFAEFVKIYKRIEVIVGVQGRYFIPLLPWLMYAVHGAGKIKLQNHLCAVIAIFAVYIAWPLTSIVTMFWG